MNFKKILLSTLFIIPLFSTLTPIKAKAGCVCIVPPIMTIEPTQFTLLKQGLASIKSGIVGEIRVLNSSLEQILKFNNTALIESMKDIEKTKKVLEKMEHVNSIAKNLCDEPDVSASLQNAYKAGGKIAQTFVKNMSKNIKEMDEADLRKKVAEFDLENQEPEKAFSTNLDDAGIVHFTNYMMAIKKDKIPPKIEKDYQYPDVVTNEKIKAEINKTKYELGLIDTIGAEILKMRTANININDVKGLKDLYDELNIDPKTDPKFKENISLADFLELKSMEFTANPTKVQEEISRNAEATLNKILIGTYYNLAVQVQQMRLQELELLLRLGGEENLKKFLHNN